MQAVGGLVTAFNLVLALVIAIRLLRLGARTQGPERWLAAFFLFCSFLGTILASVIYLSWGDPTLALPEGLRAPLHAIHLGVLSLGFYGILCFTQRVFRPDDVRAIRAVRLAAIVLIASYVAVGVTERFAVRIVSGPAYWIGVAVHEAAMVWMAYESFRYGRQLARRVKLGLADPLLANRFMLWGGWATTIALAMLADPGARIWYWSIAGTTETWVPEIGRPIVAATIAVSSLFGAVSASMLLLTFFPTAGYRRFVARSAA